MKKIVALTLVFLSLSYAQEIDFAKLPDNLIAALSQEIAKNSQREFLFNFFYDPAQGATSDNTPLGVEIDLGSGLKARPVSPGPTNLSAGKAGFCSFLKQLYAITPSTNLKLILNVLNSRLNNGRVIPELIGEVSQTTGVMVGSLSLKEYYSKIGFSPNSSYGKGFTIAVLDTGINWDKRIQKVAYSDSQSKFNNGINFLKPDANPFSGGSEALYQNINDKFSSSSSPSGHGTIVALLAAGNIGMAPAARIMNIKVCTDDGRCPMGSVIQGICWAQQAPDPLIINMSLGFRFNFPTFQRIINEVRGFIVAGSGNFSKRSQLPFEFFPAMYSKKTISVGATGGIYEKAPFSNFGPWVTMGAPGAITIDGKRYSGTSFSTAFVSGALAAANGNLSIIQGRDLKQNIGKVLCFSGDCKK